MTMRFFVICFKKEDKNFWSKCKEDHILETRRAIKEGLTNIPNLRRP